MGFTLDGCARLAAGFGDAARTIRGDGIHTDQGLPDEHHHKLYRQIHQVPIVPPPLIPNAGNGVVFAQDSMGPNTGYHWSIRRLVATGYSAGTVSIYRNAVQTGFGAAAAVTGELLFTFPQAGTFTFGRNEMLLEPDDSLVVAATGISLNAGASFIQVIGSADQLESWLLPDYIL